MSTNKTDFLNMNDWVGSDPIKREELNANFRALDAKAKEHATSLADSVSNINGRSIDILYPPVPMVAAKGDNTTDDASAIQAIINTLSSKGGGTVHIPVPASKYKFGTTVTIPHNVNLKGLGHGTSASVIKYTGSGFAIKTSGIHQRNIIEGIRLELSGSNSGIKIGDTYANLPANTVPTQFSLSHISVTDIGSGQVGIEFDNVSHVNMTDVRTGYGTASGGTGVKFAADYYNSGVVTATDCTFGRVDNSLVGLEIDGSVNQDSYTFVGCYLGGELPIKLGYTTFIRSINFYGCHAEARKLTGSVAVNTNVIELYNVLGGSWIGGTMTGFGVANTNGFVFKTDVEKFTVMGVEANGIMGTIFLKDGATLIEDNILHAPRLTNGATATIFSTSFPTKNFMFDVRKFTTENIRVKQLFTVDGINKQEYGSQIPTADSPAAGWTRGDRRFNVNTSELGTAGSKYVVQGWICTVTGTPGTWVEMRSLTGN
jgi:hypothetical protein